MRCHIAAVGTPCSGTKYVSECLQHVGLDVVHEGMGRDGIACGFTLFDVRPYPWTWAELQVDHVVRLLRHPLAVAQTLPHHVLHAVPTDHPQPWAHPDPVLAALRWWVLAQEKIPDDAAVLRIGTPELEADWARLLLGELGVDHTPLSQIPVTPAPKRRRWPAITRNQWVQRDPEYAWRALPYLDMLHGT